MSKKKNSSVRKLKVQSKHFARAHGRTAVFPQIRIEGKWLKELGFQCNEPVYVYCKEGQICITNHLPDE